MVFCGEETECGDVGCCGETVGVGVGDVGVCGGGEVCGGSGCSAGDVVLGGFWTVMRGGSVEV